MLDAILSHTKYSGCNLVVGVKCQVCLIASVGCFIIGFVLSIQLLDVIMVCHPGQMTLPLSAQFISADQMSRCTENNYT